MALEPRVAALGEEENQELKDMTRRFWIGLTLTIPVFLAAMGHIIPGRPLERLPPGPPGPGWN